MFLSRSGIQRARRCLSIPPVSRFLSQTTKVPSSADVVVIGGGSIGSSVLYHLAERGINAVLLEKDALTAGTTWHSAGLLWRLRPSDIDIELHSYTRDMCLKLEKETGIVSWGENGGLFIAKHAKRLEEYRRLSSMGQYYGIESHMLSPQETLDLYPLLNVEDIVGSMYSPTDGLIDPTNIVMAYAKAAKKIGATVVENVAVGSIETKQSSSGKRSVTAVITECGQQINTNFVVNACGVWANAIGRMVGVELPLCAMKHAYVVTEEIPGVHSGLPNVRDHDLSIYIKTQGNSLAIGGYEINPEIWDPVDPNFSFGLFDLDYDTFAQNLDGHLQRCPSIETAGITSEVCGPEGFTPDHKPLVGPDPSVNGMFHACGFNSMGMMLGGGMGREIATWITEDSPSLDLFSFDISRFHPDTLTNKKWIVDRSHESYAQTYNIIFPHDESLAGRNARKSPLHQILLDRGCVYQQRHGFERPGWFEHSGKDVSIREYDYLGAYEEGAWRLGKDKEEVEKHVDYTYLDLIEGELTFDWPCSHNIVAEECKAARNDVVIFDQSYFGKFYLEGPEASAAVEWLCAARTDKPVGAITYTPLCNKNGGVEADLTVTRLQKDQYYFVAGGNTMTKDFAWINRVIEQEGWEVKLSDHTDNYAVISVQGPQSRNLLESLVTSGHSFDNKDFPFSTAVELSVANVPLLCMRVTFVGELGYELHVLSDRAEEVYRALYEQQNVRVCDAGYRAMDSLSAEKGYRHWHADLSNRDTPMEAGIGFTVLPRLKRTDTGFLGRDALQSQRATGLRRKLICFTIDSSLPLHGMEPILRNGQVVGLVRSTAYGHSVGATIAYGYIDYPDKEGRITNRWLSEGTYVIRTKEDVPAVLHLKTVFDPKNQRVRGNY